MQEVQSQGVTHLEGLGPAWLVDTLKDAYLR
jgi:hypothetical protein